MQGVVLSVRTPRSLILGDDGVRYTFTQREWQNSNIGPQVGMRVDFEVWGSDAVDIFPIPGAAPASAAQPQASPPTASAVPPAQPPTPVPAAVESRRRLKGWHYALAGAAALIILGIVGAFVLGIFPTFGTPVGKEIARHTHHGEEYTLVEYGNELAIFSSSGAPVGERGLADGILRSYAWKQAIGEFDTDELAGVSRKVQRLDDSVSGVRRYSNDVVALLDELASLEASLPVVGSISAMDVIRDSFSGVDEAESLIRSLDSELNDLGDHAATLVWASDHIRALDLSSVSGDEMEFLFRETAAAARDLESSVRSVKEGVSAARESVEDLGDALRGASDTPIIGSVLADFARNVGGFESELSGLSNLLGGFESELDALGQDTEDALDTAQRTLEADLERWLAEPYDAEWPPTDPDRRPAGLAPRSVEPTRTSAPEVGQGNVSMHAVVLGQESFELQWHASASAVVAGDSFILTVRMYDVEQAGEHGGISVSFPLLIKSGGSRDSHSSSVADVEVLDYTSGLAQVAFHQPGATIYHRVDNQQFPASYLLVESDDPSWSTSDERTLRLRITPKVAGEFPLQIRGWLCADGYTNCSRNPTEGAQTDQQGWAVEETSVSVAMPTTQTSSPTAGRIVFQSQRDGNWEIYVMNADGTNETRLTDNDADDIVPIWSPDASRIAFSSDRGGDHDIYVMNADGSGQNRLTGSSEDDVYPSWSPDGSRIGFTSGNISYVMNADGSGLKRLMDGSGYHPVWTPDGRRITFNSNREGNFDIYVMNSDGSGPTRLTNNPGNDGSATWSADGQTIAFHSERDGVHDIYVIDADGTGLTGLSGRSGDDFNPGWSPDGRFIAFDSNRDGDHEIYVMNADGSGQTRLTDNSSDDMHTSWSGSVNPATRSVTGGEPFRLDWETSASTVAAGESFILTVRMYGVEHAGEHGGISVSFPTLMESGGFELSHSSPAADVDDYDYIAGFPQLAFYQPGATIYHRENNRQFPAEYLLVAFEYPSWSTSDEMTLRLLITPKVAGEFPVQIRGWLCADGYTNCARNPDSGPVADQQGWVAEQMWVNVEK